MNKIGLVTYYENNYGSCLQCYATKKYLEDRNLKVILINNKNNGTYRHIEKVFRYIKKVFFMMRHPSLIKKFFLVNRSNKKSNHSLSEKSKNKMRLFVERELQPQDYSLSELKKIGRTDFFDAYICGSDQIWNFSSGFFSDFYTLGFVKKGKKIAFSPSLGTENTPSFIHKKFKKSLKSFNFLSVREKKGKEILENIGVKEVVVLQDPTLLLNNNEWMKFAQSGIKLKEKYILLHFLGEPSKDILECINNVAKEKKFKLVVFAYNYDVFENVNNLHFLDGSPYDYVSLIGNAEYVFTDSFHTTLFSINLNKNFFVFERNYNGKEKQTSRIKNILNLFNYQDRFIGVKEKLTNIDNFVLNDVSEILKTESEKMQNFLENIQLNKKDSKKISNETDCVGCNICKEICTFKSINYINTGLACHLPVINKDKCKNCSLCNKVCNKTIEYGNNYQKKAYVGYNFQDDERESSASGGCFTSLAKNFLKSGGIVYGAQLLFEEGKPSIKHIKITSPNEIAKIQNSKYVRSSCIEAYKEIKEIIKQEKRILFCGTPCQVDGLNRYLRLFYDVDFINKKVFSIDLICHGNPSLKLFSDYIDSINKKYKGKVTDFKFRRKKDEKIYYEEEILIESNKVKRKIIIPVLKSAYYKMFLDGESYYEACYYCKYASKNRPANITLGDYFELQKDYPEIFDKVHNKSVNCIIINDEIGEKLLKEYGNNIQLYDVEFKKVQASHQQLCKPMKESYLRYKLINLYNQDGFNAIEKYYKKDYIIKLLPRKLYSVLKRIRRK